VFGLNVGPGQQSGQTTGGGIGNILGSIGNIFGGNAGIGPGGTGTFTGAPAIGGGNTGLAQILRNFSGGGSTGFAGGTGSLLGGGAGLQGLFGAEGGGVGLPPEAARNGILGTLLGGGTGLGAAAGRGGLFGNVARSFAPALPFLGVGLGAQLGGGGLGSVLGGAGGLLLGGAGLAGLSALLAPTAAATVAAAGAGGSIFGAGGIAGALAGGGSATGGLAASLGAFFTNPFTIGIGAALLVGALVIAKNKKRRESEKLRDKLSTDAFAALNQLLNQVRRDKIGVDEALAQAETIRSQYMAGAQSIPDSKARRHAIADVSRLDSIITQIRAAGVSQTRRQELDRLLVPEFASGAHIVPGKFGAGDVVPALLSPGEMVLNRSQQAAVGFSALSRANVPSYVSNGRYGSGGYAQTISPRTFTNTESIGDIYIVADKKFAEDMAVAGRDKIVNMAATDINGKGKIHSAIRRIK
jgi:hypothetical protein